MTKLVISSIGKDRSGIVGAFTKVLYEFNCNIEDASMTILANQFAMILIITTPENLDVTELKESLKSVESKFRLSTTITVLENDFNANEALEKSKPYMICVSGNDKTGIAYNITNILAKFNVNITDFNSKLVGKKTNPIYVMILETQVPVDINFAEFQSELKSTAEKLNLDLNINEIEYCEL